MTEHEEMRATEDEMIALPVFVDPNHEDWDVLMQRAEKAILIRRAAKKSRENKPISFSTPSLWSLSGSADER